jgi:hypothetical protein
VRIGAGKKPGVSDKAVRIKSLSGTYHDVRCITAIELPASFFGKKVLKAGDKLALDSSFTTHGRARRIEWRGDFVLRQ